MSDFLLGRLKDLILLFDTLRCVKGHLKISVGSSEIRLWEQSRYDRYCENKT